MNLVLTVGDWRPKSEYLHHLLEAGYLLGSSDQHAEEPHPLNDANAVGLVAALESDADVAVATSMAEGMELSWLGWDCGGAASMAAYRKGALAVLPPRVSPADLEHAIGKFLCGPKGRDARQASPEIRRYRPNDPVEVGADTVIEVHSGVLAMRASLPGGSELLMGLFGTGDFVSGDLTAVSHVQLVAHSAAELSVHRWRDVATTWEFAHRTQRLQSYLAAWYSVHSHPRVEQRILGILTLLAERFGRPGGAGWGVIDVRITHQHLADAVCASRPTVSTAMRTLSKDQVIKFKGTGERRRIRLNPDRARHMATQ